MNIEKTVGKAKELLEKGGVEHFIILASDHKSIQTVVRGNDCILLSMFVHVLRKNKTIALLCDTALSYLRKKEVTDGE